MTRPAQCGRTFPHLPHDTEEGHCAGLPGVRRAGGPAPVEPPLMIRQASAVGDDPEVLNPEVLGGRGLLFLPPDASWIPLEDRRGEDPWEEGTGAGYDVRALRAGLAAILSHATVAEDYATAARAASVLAGEPLPAEDAEVSPPLVYVSWCDHRGAV